MQLLIPGTLGTEGSTRNATYVNVLAFVCSAMFTRVITNPVRCDAC